MSATEGCACAVYLVEIIQFAISITAEFLPITIHLYHSIIHHRYMHVIVGATADGRLPRNSFPLHAHMMRRYWYVGRFSVYGVQCTLPVGSASLGAASLIGTCTSVIDRCYNNSKRGQLVKQNTRLNSCMTDIRPKNGTL